MYWPALAAEATAAARRFVATATGRIGARVGEYGIDREQRAAHGLAWMATLAEAIAAVAETPPNGAAGLLALRIGVAELLAQLVSGIAMSPTEIVRPAALGLADAANDLAADPAVAHFLAEGDTAETRAALARLLGEGAAIGAPLDPTHDLVRDQIRAFVADRITPDAHRWHRDDALIPDAIIAEMAALGVFGITIPEVFGGSGLGKLAMCVVSEELSRGWICAGSLGTRAEIAAELILAAGTEAQRAHWLPRLAAGTTLPTAVFTEPDSGSDLASLTTRAVPDADGWRIHGAKTWITHAARADLMTLLVRTDADVPGHGGLSILLAGKTRGTEAMPFPDEGLDGSEIAVLGYRGMREYALGFDGFRVGADALLGGEQGRGFRQLMHTFESARIQTAARAIGVAQNALELMIGYAADRRQFGRPIADFPRVADKIALSAAEIAVARALTHAAARRKDAGERCDMEAGMAKLLAARVAWTSADQAVQVHGGNGYALEFPVSRVLCDARILNIFEGAAEIQAQVIARRLLG